MANTLKRTLCATALCGVIVAASAQTIDAPATTLPAVTISGKGNPVAGVAGWRDVPLSSAPFQASVLSAEQMSDRGAERLSDLSRLDPAVSDAYNAEGYWDSLTVRGYVIDNRFNYRRDGLPINAETSIPLDNKERIELLKGTSGLQAGTSAPGGLVNLVVKRPLAEAWRSAQLAWRESRTVLGTVDISQRLGQNNALGLRVNASAERLAPQTHHAKGERNLLAVAGDWRLTPDTLLEAEFETSHRSQPSAPGFSLLGSTVPAPADPRVNLNNQPWSLPVVFDANSASLRFTQTLGTDWGWSAHLATQRLRTDDRVAFAFGFDCHPESRFTYCDRYNPAGEFDLYDFRSENERRTSDALELAMHRKLHIGTMTHALSIGVLRSLFRARFQGLTNNFVGTGNIRGGLETIANPEPMDDNTNRDEHSTEIYVRNRISLGVTSTAWVGLRHTHLSRSSVSMRGDRDTATDRDTADTAASYTQDFTTPWVAISHEFAPRQLAYASWGQGVESFATPNLPAYGVEAGQPLPTLKSRQIEVGLKGHRGDTTWNLAWFDIDRPATTDTGSSFFIDGSARHRGIEGGVETDFGAWALGAGAMVLNAKRRDSQTVNGLRPTNVPRHTVKLRARYRVGAVHGLDVVGSVLHQGQRMVLPDNSISIPGYTRADVSLRYRHRVNAATLTWRAGIDNLFDRRAWRESPFQFGHAYLFPLPARSARLSAQVTW